MTATDAPSLVTPAVTPMLVEQAARYLDVTPETVRRRIRAGTLEAHRDTRDGRRVLVVDVPARSATERTEAYGDTPLAHGDTPLAHDGASPTHDQIADMARRYDAHLADLRDAIDRLQASHRDTVERLTAAHRDTLDALVAAHDSALRRIDALLDVINATKRRHWWHLW